MVKQTKKIKANSSKSTTTVANGEEFVKVDVNGQMTLIPLANLKTAIFGNMNVNDNRQLHSTILQSLAALREYDKVQHWDDEMQEEVQTLLQRLEQCVEKERLYYAMYRNIKLTDD